MCCWRLAAGCLVTQSQPNYLIITKSSSHRFFFSFWLRLDLNTRAKVSPIYWFSWLSDDILSAMWHVPHWVNGHRLQNQQAASFPLSFKQLLHSSHGRDNNKEAVAVNLLNLWRRSQTNPRNVANTEHGAQWRGRGHQWLPDLSGLYMHFRFTFLLVTALRSSQCLPRLAYSTAAWIAIVVQRTSLFVSLYMPLICHDFQDLRPNVCKSHVCFSASTCAPMLSATFCSIAWTICQMLLDF